MEILNRDGVTAVITQPANEVLWGDQEKGLVRGIPLPGMKSEDRDAPKSRLVVLTVSNSSDREIVAVNRLYTGFVRAPHRKLPRTVAPGETISLQVSVGYLVERPVEIDGTPFRFICS